MPDSNERRVCARDDKELVVTVSMAAKVLGIIDHERLQTFWQVVETAFSCGVVHGTAKTGDRMIAALDAHEAVRRAASER